MPLAILAAPAALEVPAKNVSVTRMARCLSPVTPSQDSARAAPEPQGRSVTAASTGMHARAWSVCVRTLTSPFVLGASFHFCLVSSENDWLFPFSAIANATRHSSWHCLSTLCRLPAAFVSIPLSPEQLRKSSACFSQCAEDLQPSSWGHVLFYFVHRRVCSITQSWHRLCDRLKTWVHSIFQNPPESVIGWTL